MRPAESISSAAFICFVLLGWLLRLSWRQQKHLILLALAGCAQTFGIDLLSVRFPSTARGIGDWLPGLWILIVYWQSGCFHTRTSQKLQNWLERMDRCWIGGLPDIWEKDWSKSWLGGYLEFAYLFCGPLVPLGIAVLYFAHLRTRIDGYWITVLTSTYLCYLEIPVAAALPPRMIHARTSRGSKLQRFNLFILRRAGIELDTFPSAHVATSIAISIVLLQSVPLAGILFLLASLSIAAGAVLGRYHYLPDVVLGALLPVAIAFVTLG